ncbi:MAG: MarR family transcriptional regulator [Microbacterium sp.]|nr:MarR family transcriptional regulator [Microbacterium sp.]
MTTTSPSGTTPDGVVPEDPERIEAMHALEGAFSELMAEWRRIYVTAAETASPGMLPGSYKVLTVIERTGPITLSALAERVSADKGLTSRSVSELEDRGFVSRTADPADGRVRLIAITAEGTERLNAARAPHERRLAETLGQWPLETIGQLTELLGALARGETPRA